MIPTKIGTAGNPLIPPDGQYTGCFYFNPIDGCSSSVA